MAFLESPSFPNCPSLGNFNAQPDYDVSINRTVSARERRNRNWERSLATYNLRVGPRKEEEIQELLEFWHALGGAECGFRFKDWADFKSCRVHQDATALDQELVLIAGSPGGYQLTKTYTFGPRTQIRKILKPVDGTILIANNGTVLNEGSQYVLDYTTGLLTLFVAPAGPITWGGEFDVPVRFNSPFPVELVDYKIESVSFELIELRDPQNED